MDLLFIIPERRIEMQQNTVQLINQHWNETLKINKDFSILVSRHITEICKREIDTSFKAVVDCLARKMSIQLCGETYIFKYEFNGENIMLSPYPRKLSNRNLKERIEKILREENLL